MAEAKQAYFTEFPALDQKKTLEQLDADVRMDQHDSERPEPPGAPPAKKPNTGPAQSDSYVECGRVTG